MYGHYNAVAPFGIEIKSLNATKVTSLFLQYLLIYRGYKYG
jgi:hypothetical protein